MKLYRDKVWLTTKYVNNKLSLSAIARECHVTPMAIQRWMVKFGIERRTVSAANTGRKNGSFKGGLVEQYNWMKRQCDKGFSQRDIARKAKVAHRTAVRWLKIHNLKTQHLRKIKRGKNHPNYRESLRICECGKNKHRTSKLCRTCDTKRKTGKTSPLWKGIADIMTSVRGRVTPQWRNAIFIRDNYTCISCGDDRGGNLNAHHIVKLSKLVSTILGDADLSTSSKRCAAIDLLCTDRRITSIDNGITLCEECHIDKHRTKGAKNVRIQSNST